VCLSKENGAGPFISDTPLDGESSEWIVVVENRISTRIQCASTD